MALIGSINSPNDFGLKNRIINGAIGIWQRGTSFTSGGSATYTADRFFGNASSGTISRSTDVPAGFTYSFSNAASSTAFPGIAQRIESVNIADCASQAITVSFYVKQTSGTATALNINLAYPSAVDNWSSSTTIIETNVVATMTASWTQYSYTYTLPANVTNGLSVTLFIPSASVTATFLITGIQVEKGSIATGFDYRPYGTELGLCQRYYEKSFPATWVPGTASFATGFIATTSPSASGAEASGATFIVPKRASPTIVTYNAVTGASASAYRVSDGANVSSTPTHVNEGAIGYIAVPSNANGYYWHFTASAEL